MNYEVNEHTRLLVEDRRSGERYPAVESDPALTSAGRGFKDFLLEHHRLKSQELLDVAAVETLIGVHLNNSIKVEIKDADGPFRSRFFHPGDVAVLPAGSPYSIRFDGEAEFIIMKLDGRVINFAVDALNGKSLENQPVAWGARDSFIRETITGLAAAVDKSRHVDRIYAESLSNSLAAHLARNGERIIGAPTANDRGLSRTQLNRVIEFIHGSPYREINLESMAAAAGLSPFHFSRMFKLSTGHSPHQYVLRRRIEIGAEMLASRNLSVGEIAQELGFADQSHFTMHFKRAHGMGPATYRRKIAC